MSDTECLISILGLQEVVVSYVEVWVFDFDLRIAWICLKLMEFWSLVLILGLCQVGFVKCTCEGGDWF